MCPPLSVICVIPITKALNKMKAGYTRSGGDLKINHLFFMEDLKLFSKNEREIDGLLSSVQLLSKYICMEFGIKKSGMLFLKRGKVARMEEVVLTSQEKVDEVALEGYKYLSMLEYDKVKEQEMKQKLRNEYLGRTYLILRLKLNGRNKVKLINTCAVPLMRYGAGVMKWKKDALQKIDRRTRKLMTMHKIFNPNSDVQRLYLPRKKGGRGLTGCEDCHNGGK